MNDNEEAPEIYVVDGHVGHGEGARVIGAFLDRDAAIACAKETSQSYFVEVWGFRGATQTTFVGKFYPAWYDPE